MIHLIDLDGRDVYINPDTIFWMRDYDDMNRVHICIVVGPHKDSVYVQGRVKSIRSRINEMESY